MTKSDLQNLIRQEMSAVVRTELQKMLRPLVLEAVKPLVKEAVAGALGSLLAEGIVNGTPLPKKSQILTPNIPQARAPAGPGSRPAASGRTLDPSTRRRMAEQLGYGEPAAIGIDMGGGMVGDILNETAMEMSGRSSVDSILDAADDIGAVAPEVVDAITRDYSGLMAAMNRRGKING